ncbi:dehydrogenase [Micromonospora chalcea]|uniref:dehydrogenase n=1 Tax=Micromonospora chalcea TaxID=1874 RepID=UPI001656D25F|nr:dehydrogenase [Micromonospora chalcea]MBC8991458.1 dehydrogenase [Micromonospora chalcea]
MTGATAGLSAHALDRIAAQPGTRVIIGARGAGRKVPAGVEILPLDLASLDQVRGFADAVLQRIGDARIDVLVLNAGMQSPAIRAVTPITPKALDPLALAHPAKGGLGSGMRAYAASKLCNLLTAQAVAASADVQDRGVSVVAFNPGLTGGTSLGRDSSPVARIVVRALMGAIFRVVGLFKPEYVMSTAERSGEQLAQVALGVVTPPPGRIYVSLVKGEPTFPDPSELARSRDAQQQLWRDSADMVGLGAGNRL